MKAMKDIMDERKRAKARLQERLKTVCSHNLAKLRQESELSLGDVAREIGSTPSAISHYETGLNLPTVLHLVMLADLYCVTPNDLLSNRRKR